MYSPNYLCYKHKLPCPSITNPYEAKRNSAIHDGMDAQLFSSRVKGTQDWCLTVDSASIPNFSPKHSSVPNGK